MRATAEDDVNVISFSGYTLKYEKLRDHEFNCDDQELIQL